jgi:hypothetical protein
MFIMSMNVIQDGASSTVRVATIVTVLPFRELRHHEGNCHLCLLTLLRKIGLTLT